MHFRLLAQLLFLATAVAGFDEAAATGFRSVDAMNLADARIIPSSVERHSQGTVGVTLSNPKIAPVSVPHAIGEYRVAQRSTTPNRGIQPTPSPDTRAQPEITVTSTNLAPNTASPGTFEMTVWGIVKQSRDPSDVNAYLDMFPNGRFVEQARENLHKLQRDLTNSSDFSKLRESNQDIARPDPETAEKNLNLLRGDRALVQRGLNALEFSAGAEDGLFGPTTRGAIRRYQSAMGPATTGYLTKDQASVLVELGRSIAPLPPIETAASARHDKAKSGPETADRTTAQKTSYPRQSLQPGHELPSAAQPSPRLNQAASAPSTSPPPVDFVADREFIKEAIVDFIINVGSNNCWGDIYFCYLDEITDITLSQTRGNSLTVVSQYKLISSDTLEASAEKRKFVSEFILIKYRGKYQVISVRTVKIANAEKDNIFSFFSPE
jgi:peptidoglycan hydrolase-like protein with peptidoglycan-binding domain